MRDRIRTVTLLQVVYTFEIHVMVLWKICPWTIEITTIHKSLMCFYLLRTMYTHFSYFLFMSSQLQVCIVQVTWFLINAVCYWRSMQNPSQNISRCGNTEIFPS